MKRIGLLVGLLAVCALRMEAQQMPLYSQYTMNGFLLNPAVAGSEGYTMANLTAREQWVGFPGGPSTYAMSFQTRLLNKSYISRSHSVRRRKQNKRNGNVGLGGYIFSHTNGAVNRLGIKGSYAYHIKFPFSQLSFGLSVMGYQYRLLDDKITFKEENDRLWNGAHKSVFIPEADVGVYFTREDFWAGFSVDQLLESTLKFGDSGYDQFVLERTYYLTGGYDFMVRRDLIISPSTLVKVSEAGVFQADLSAKMFINQEYWAGLTYRTGHSIIVLAGVSVDRFVFGYSFDIGLNSIMKHSFGTHEFSFIAKLGNKVQRYRWLSRF
jgi:type IX secretion system PorP/SprF family membrane protein